MMHREGHRDGHGSAIESLAGDFELLLSVLREEARRDARVADALARLAAALRPPAPRRDQPVTTRPEKLVLGPSSATVEVLSSAPSALLGHEPPPAPAPVHVPGGESFYPIDRSSTASAPAVDLTLIARRAAIKAGAARWAIRRARLVAEKADFQSVIRPEERVQAEAVHSVPDCNAWMLDPYRAPRSEGDVRTLEIAAHAYDNLAFVARHAHECYSGPDVNSKTGGLKPFLELAAEAQSALRCLLIAILGKQNDVDQDQFFQWLKGMTKAHQIFIQRYMRVDDPADPLNHESIAQRLSALPRRMTEAPPADPVRERRKLVSRIHHHLNLLESCAHDQDDVARNWQRIIETLDLWVSEGFPPSDRLLRETLSGHLDAIPDAVIVSEGGGAERVLGAIDQALTEAEQASPTRPSRQSMAPEVAPVRAALAGSRVALVGGAKRPQSHAALLEALGPAELDWITAHEAASVDRIDSRLQGVRLVLLAIRWCSHRMTEEIPRRCRERNIPCVRLSAGYSPNIVAHAIMSQASGALGIAGCAAPP